MSAPPPAASHAARLVARAEAAVRLSGRDPGRAPPAAAARPPGGPPPRRTARRTGRPRRGGPAAADERGVVTAYGTALRHHPAPGAVARRNGTGARGGARPAPPQTSG